MVPLIRRHMPELDALRGVAVLMVLFYHGFFWSNGVVTWTPAPMRVFVDITRAGWLGVDLFFVLSGFLITGILIESKSRADYYRRFYYRRALRILPAYFALLALLLIARVVHLRFAVVSSLFAANFAGLLGVANEYGPLWSLAVEEQWYLLWPTAVKHFTRRIVTAIALVIVLGSWAFRFVAFRLGYTDGLWGYTWFTADGLAMGALLAIALRSPKATHERCAIGAIVLSLIGFALLIVGWPHGVLTRTTAWGAAFQSLIFVLIFAGAIVGALVFGSRYRVRSRVLLFFGEISYGLYLIHVLGFSLYDEVLVSFGLAGRDPHRSAFAMILRFAIAGGASIGVAYLSRRYFEEWFLRLKERPLRFPFVLKPTAADPVTQGVHTPVAVADVSRPLPPFE